MGWELRKGRPYFYRKRRVGGRIVREYVGPPAGVFHLVPRPHLPREPRRPDTPDVDPAAASVAAYYSAADLITCAALLAGGYHQHKGQWRYDYHHQGTRPTRGRDRSRAPASRRDRRCDEQD